MTSNNQKNAILITGSNGFVGRSVTLQLENDFILKKLVINRPNPGDLCFDLTKDLTPEIIDEAGKVDQVIHLAALTPKTKEDNSLEKSKDFYLNNILGTVNLLGLIKNKSIKHFVCISTLDVYGLGRQEISEDTPIHPETYYAASKYAAEQACQIFCQSQNIPLAILRLGHVYGPGEGLYRKVIPIFINKALNHEPLCIYGKGRALRDFIYIDDVARAIAHVSKQKVTGVFNIVSGKSVSVLELAKLINSITGNTAGIQFIEEDFVETDFIFNSSKLESIGFQPKTTLKEGLNLEINLAKQ